MLGVRGDWQQCGRMMKYHVLHGHSLQTNARTRRTALRMGVCFTLECAPLRRYEGDSVMYAGVCGAVLKRCEVVIKRFENVLAWRRVRAGVACYSLCLKSCEIVSLDDC